MFELISNKLPAKELNLLASESIAACHGRGLLFGQEGMEEEENKEKSLGVNGPFGASATWSRGMLLVSILRIVPSKRVKFLQASLPEISRLLLGGDDSDDLDDEGSEQIDGISKVLALITFIRGLATPHNDDASKACLLLHILDTAGACGVIPAGPVEMAASELFTPPVHALWCGLVCLAFGDPNNVPFDWPECISYLPPFVSTTTHAVNLVDTVSLLQHPWRYAYNLWERESTGRKQPASANSLVEYGLGVVRPFPIFFLFHPSLIMSS